MPSCDRCGFFLSRRDAGCATCRDRRVVAFSSTDADGYREPAVTRSPPSPGIAVVWIATAPFVLIVSLLLPEQTDLFSPLGHAVVVLYFSAALLIDARQVALRSPARSPNLRFWVGASLLNVATFGLLTFVLAPYYLHRRRRLAPIE